MIHPVVELRAFIAAAVVAPVPRDHREPDALVRRRRVVSALTLVVGAVVLAVTLRIPPGDESFYVGGLALAGVWAVGSLAAGRLHVGWAHTRESGLARPVVQPVALALLAVGVFVAGAVVVGAVPWLADRVDAVLDHARYGSLPIVWLITVVTGVGEELFFRGALFAAVGSRHALAVTTLVYTLVTAATGNVMLTFAALLLGLLTGAQRRVTGGVLAPVITHVIWSSSMLVLLPPALDLLR
ncbi:CPBP family intramembrane metalloprotease [Janibacter sp. CX7]|uniref:CPBP family intramembrane glutamic endopeptidase n=1 Tax=Janibacter sp. CX7 TaxID=2963431 RepID=UPI0020CF4EEC|nr:CPBP family intramembrane glutamic endopeptidase [Janibacter sp. CX7]UTT67278.1 CPBP family intramembrane metalloprotease [Janibacter sp. CX7]